MDVRTLLQKRCRRRIGNGEDTLLYHHPWLLDEDAPFFQTILPPRRELARAADLIDFEHRR